MGGLWHDACSDIVWDKSPHFREVKNSDSEELTARDARGAESRTDAPEAHRCTRAAALQAVQEALGESSPPRGQMAFACNPGRPRNPAAQGGIAMSQRAEAWTSDEELVG